jgi:hypothetical protein
VKVQLGRVPGPRKRVTAAVLAMCAVLGLAACTKIATHESGQLLYDAVEQEASGSFVASQDVPAYAGSWIAKAHLAESATAPSHGRGVFSTAPANGVEGVYGAAFYFPPGTFSGPAPKLEQDLDIMGWEYGGGAEVGGVRISASDKKARLIRERSSQADVIGSSFALQEGCWNHLVVSQRLSPFLEGDPNEATSELYLNGEKLFTSHLPNSYGNPAQNVRFGIVKVNTPEQDQALDVYLDDANVSTYDIKQPGSRACDPQTGV